MPDHPLLQSTHSTDQHARPAQFTVSDNASAASAAAASPSVGAIKGSNTGKAPGQQGGFAGAQKGGNGKKF